jgi:hypothetical protein
MENSSEMVLPSEQRMAEKVLKEVASRVETEVTVQTHSEGYARGRAVEKILEDADGYGARANEQEKARREAVGSKRVPHYVVEQEKGARPERWWVYRQMGAGMTGMRSGITNYTSQEAARRAAEVLGELGSYELDVALQGE